MTDESMPGAGRPQSAILKGAGTWLKMHGLTDAQPTPLIAMRLSARWRARLAGSVLLALFLIAVALINVAYLGSEPARPAQLVVLTAAVAALVTGQMLVDRWVRRVDRRAAATLVRRAAHPARLGWRTVLGLPRAVLWAATFAGQAALGVAALAVGDAAGRQAATILLIGLCGVAISMSLQLRHLLTHPAVADDEVSLTADAIMRVEDAREMAVPSALWCLPTVSLLATVPGWWTAAWIAFVLAGVVALILITARTAPSGRTARQAMSPINR
jgi:hypothetical protein